MGYNQVYRAAKDDPNAFWMEAAKGIDWDVAPSRALFDDNAPFYEWFADGKLNGCWNAVDRHVQAGHGDRVAIIHDSPLTGTTHKITYKELKDRVASLAGALKAKGIEKGDRVIIYMPMVPEALEAMLACARLGAIHSVVFGGFAALHLRHDRPAQGCGARQWRAHGGAEMVDGCDVWREAG
jgi:propionyl-CoA synthetase